MLFITEILSTINVMVSHASLREGHFPNGGVMYLTMVSPLFLSSDYISSSVRHIETIIIFIGVRVT